MNTKYVHTNLDNPFYTDLDGLLYHDIVRMWPTMPFEDPNGHYMRNGKLAQLTNDSRSKTSNDNVYLQGQLVFHPMKGWNIYANVGLRLISQFKKQNLNKVYEYNVENEPLLLSYGSTYTAGQTGAMQHWTNDNHLTTSLYSDYSFSINQHMFKVMAGVNTEKYNNRYLSVKRMDLISENVRKSVPLPEKMLSMKPAHTHGRQQVFSVVLTTITLTNISLRQIYATTVLHVSCVKTVGESSDLSL